MCPLPDQVKTKGAPKGWPKCSTKRPSYSQEKRSTKRSPSLFEHAESQHLDTPLPLFMHQFTENVIEVAGDEHCGFRDGFRDVAGLIGESE
ncbi:hypothetical protein A2U01_0039564, partial [Trifolium medium]|nr:hypothetical protein [Trifolium medium]